MARFEKCSRIRTASKTVPNSRRTGVQSFVAKFRSYVFGLKMAQEPRAADGIVWMSETRTGRFNKGLQSNGAVRRDSVHWDHCKGKDGALTALSYDGTAARVFADCTITTPMAGFQCYLIRQKSGTFYDQNSALNSSLRSPRFARKCGFLIMRTLRVGTLAIAPTLGFETESSSRFLRSKSYQHSR